MATTYKSVFTLDDQTQTYRPTAHNVTAEHAVEQFNSNPKARIKDQGERHRNPDPLKCQHCKKVAEDLSAQHAAVSAGSEQSEGTTQESEND